MKVSTFYLFLSIVFLSKISSCSELNTEDYVHLILDLYDTYQPSSVLLVYFADIDSPSEMKIVFEMMLILSKRKILTLTIPLEEIHPYKNYSVFSHKDQEIRQTTRSMSVIFFISQKAIDKLKHFSEHMNLDVSINFILFMVNDDSFDGYCNESFRQNLQSSFHATVLFKCYGDPAIKKWNPFNRNQTEFSTWAHWDPRTTLILKRKDCVHTKRDNLGGKVLRIATVESSCLTQWKDGKLIGYLADVLRILEEIMNFKTKHMKEEKEFGSWNENSKTWSGAMGLIVKGEIDLVVSDLSMTSLRLRSVDFSEPLFSSQSMLYIKQPSNEKAIIWSGYFQPFHYKIWSVIILILIISPLILTLMKIKLNDSYKLSSLISESYINVWGIFCQQGLKEFPTISSLRLAYFSIFISSFIIVSLYSARLISKLTVPTSSLPFSTLEGFVQDGSYKLSVLRDGSNYDMFRNSNDLTLRKMNKLMMPKSDLPSNVQDAFNLVCNTKIAFYDSEILSEIGKNNISCQLVKIPTGRYDTTGMVLCKRSPYRMIINYHLAKLRSKGILNRLKLKYFRKIVQPTFETFNSVNLPGIATILMIIAGGIILALTILFIEKICFNHKLENILL